MSGRPRAPGGVLGPALRTLLVCPGCRGALVDAPAGLICRPCERLYPVVAGIPRMAPEEALSTRRQR